MKKIISVILTLAMIASAMSAMTITASANATWAGTGNSTWHGAEDGSGIDYVDALYFENAPSIDGYVTEAEWGKCSIEMYSEDLGTKSEGFSYYNSFFYWKGADDAASLFPMEAMVWLRWDENYFYVAALVRDRDGHSLKHGKRETWNGDAIEFRVDSEGANAATGGDAYDPNIGTPWSDNSKVLDLLVGYSQIAGGFTEVYDGTNDKGLTVYSKPVFGEVKAAVAPSEQLSDNPLGYHEDAAAGYTTYEIAIPWKYVYENHLVPNYGTLTDAEKAPYTLDYSEYSRPTGKPGRPNYNPGNLYGGIGKKLGMSLVVFNGARGYSTYNSFMSWGSGVVSVQNDIAPQTCAGSNQVTLVADKVVQGEYDKYDPSNLESSGSAAEYDSVFYDYLGGDTDCENPLTSSDKLTTLTYENVIHGITDYKLAEDQKFWGSFENYGGSVIDVGGDHGYVLNYDRVVQTHTDDDGNVHEAGVDPIDQFYIDTSLGYDNNWELIGGQYPLSYTFEFDVMYTGNQIVQEGRVSELGNIFGGNSVDYYCGYSFMDKCFVIRSFNDPTDVIAQSKAFNLQKDTWYNWKFQFDNETCTLRLLINDEVIFNVTNRYFYYSNENNLTNGSLLCWWFINTQMKMDNVKIYNFYDYIHKDVVDPSDPSGPIVTPTHSYDVSGIVSANIKNDTSGAPIYVNLYEDGSDTVYESIVIESTDDGFYKFDDVPEGVYIIEFKKDKCVTERYRFTLNSDDSWNLMLDSLQLIGDVDLNGTVNAHDVIYVKQGIVKIATDDTFKLDVNYDGNINAKDLLIIKKILLGK